jgi:multicomponent K+:H+ antiporter subunit G
MMPPLAEIIVALLLLASGGVVLVAALGLVRLGDFFARMHAPALASTLAAWIVTLASIVHFSTRGGGLSLHVWLVIIVLSITAPVTTIVLARAALFRRRQAGDALPPPLGGRL